MPPLKMKLNPDAVLERMIQLREALEESLSRVVRLEEIAKQVDSDEWGQEVWDLNVWLLLEELHADLKCVQRLI